MSFTLAIFTFARNRDDFGLFQQEYRQPYCSHYHYGVTLTCFEEGALSLQENISPFEEDKVFVHG